jgi:type I restriction enzyme M protein
MTQSDFKNQVDNLMNILWGAGVASHATIIEQINYLVFLRSLSRKDDNAMKLDPSAEMLFSGELKKYNWNNLLILNAEELFNTLEEVFRRLPEVTKDQTIKLLFRDAHVKIFDKPTLRRLVHEIEKMFDDLEKLSTSGHTDIFGDMYEYLLSKLSQAGTLGSFRTPRHIIKFIVDIIDPKKGETILDPACGTAGFLVAALKHLEEKYTSEDYKKIDKYPMDLLSSPEREFVYKHTFTGFDSDFDMFKFGLMNLYLHKLEHPNIKRQNTLVDTAGDRTKWDVILANPPFAGALDIDSISEDLRMGTRSTEILFLRYIIDHLSSSGRAGVIVPEGVVFNSTNAHKKIRQMLVEDAGLWCVVSLPGGIFNPYAGVKTSILFFDKSLKDKVKDILFVKVENDGFDLGANKKIVDGSDLPNAILIANKYRDKLRSNSSETLNSSVGNSIYIPILKVRDGNEYNLMAERYVQSNIQNTSKWPMYKLGDLCKKITDGSHNPPKSQINGLPMLSSKNVIDGGITYNGARFLTTEDFEKENKRTDINPGDVLLTIVGTIGRVALVDISHGKFTVQRSVAVIKLDNDKIISKYLSCVLSSKKMQEELSSKAAGVAQKGIYLGQLSKIEIPVPPLEIQKQIVEQLDEYQNKIEKLEEEIQKNKNKIKNRIEEVWN